MKIESSTIRAKVYPLMREAVEAGAAYGLRRARKHVEHPTDDQTVDAIVEAVLSEICDRFVFDDE